MVNMGIIGLGHWGPNLLRNFCNHPDVNVKAVCDKAADKKTKITESGIEFTQNCTEITASGNGIDAVAVVTPLATHFEIARTALENGKHLFIEKPVAPTSAEALELIELAKRKNLRFMVGHVFLYNAGIRFVKEQITGGELGKILYIHGQRTNLGPVRPDASALWDLAAHDVSIFNYWLDALPENSTANGSALLNPAVEDIVNATFSYPDNIKCNILASWLHPSKVRRITVVGDKKMLIWDDMSQSEPIKIFDKSIHCAEMPEQIEGTLTEFRFSIQDGQVFIPRIKQCEPLKEECNHFIDCILNNTVPLSDGVNGYHVVAALEAATESLHRNSEIVERSEEH
ncbi:MAG: Gfo/Idh/MocA family oxidoreductase, partial [Victivallaceae bacterium]|nr:Gfo/Idh/MocA family oxidoreductase [Victivallaceae bacterium]